MNAHTKRRALPGGRSISEAEPSATYRRYVLNVSRGRVHSASTKSASRKTPSTIRTLSCQHLLRHFQNRLRGSASNSRMHSREVILVAISPFPAFPRTLARRESSARALIELFKGSRFDAIPTIMVARPHTFLILYSLRTCLSIDGTRTKAWTTPTRGRANFRSRFPRLLTTGHGSSLWAVGQPFRRADHEIRLILRMPEHVRRMSPGTMQTPPGHCRTCTTRP